MCDKKLKIFISYSHVDDERGYLGDFLKYIEQLKDHYPSLEVWYDKKIKPGEDFQKKIDKHFETSQIICLLLSENYFASGSCKSEMKKALQLRDKKYIEVIPIVLSNCGWKDYANLQKLLVLPKDGRPISSYRPKAKGWNYVYEKLKEVIKDINYLQSLELNEEFNTFLDSTDFLTQAHSKRERLLLSDIFVYPELESFNNYKELENKNAVNFKDVVNNINEYKKLLIFGEDQSGKTSIGKIIFKKYLEMNFLPVYIPIKTGEELKGALENRIFEFMKKTYKNFDDRFLNTDIMDKLLKRIVIIVDDFHLLRNRGKYIKRMNSLIERVVLLTDDIFSLNIEDNTLLGEYYVFRIKELKPSLRYELVKKWVTLGSEENVNHDDLKKYKIIDERIRLIDETLGKSIGRGILPSYPFFILSAILAYETFGQTLDRDITTQGYCYQAFIYNYLRKKGVKNEDIDTYINFLTEFAYFLYRNRKEEITEEAFALFIEGYTSKFNLPISVNVLMENLSLLIQKNSLGNYSFRYPYIYYFFVSKYMAENLHSSDTFVKEEVLKNLENIMSNLHVESNAYIAIFMVHHSKDVKILEELLVNAIYIFDGVKEATLSKEEVAEVDNQIFQVVHEVIRKSLPPKDEFSTETNRKELMRIHDEIDSMENNEQEDDVGADFRRAVRTMEVIGSIIRNRAGSLEVDKLQEMFMTAMDLMFRAITLILTAIKDEKIRDELVKFIEDRLRKIDTENKRKNLGKDEVKREAFKVLWMLIFIAIYGIIYKIVHSLGADKLTDITKKVCDEINTPSTVLVKHGIIMWYKKSLDLDGLVSRMEQNDFSDIARIIAKLMVIDYCRLHPISYRDRQRIRAKLGLWKHGSIRERLSPK